MSSWKLGTCACRVSGVPGPYPYFRVPVAELRGETWSGASTIRVGELISYYGNGIYEATHEIVNPVNSFPIFSATVSTGFYAATNEALRYTFRPRGFPIATSLTGFGHQRGALWEPELTERVRRIVPGTGGGPFYPEWELYGYADDITVERNCYPDISRPFTFSRWSERVDWRFLDPQFRPAGGRLERVYVYDPNTRTERLDECRAFDESGNRTDINGESPILEQFRGGSWATVSPYVTLHANIGSQFAWPNLPTANSSGVGLLDFTLEEDFQSWTFRVVGGLDAIITQSIRVSDPIS